MKPDKISSYIGFAMKAGRLSAGEFSTEKSVKEGRARLVITASNASANTKKKFKDMCAYYGVPIIEYGSKEELGRMIGREYRACAAINDAGLANALIKAM